jgi:glucokinase
MKIIGIDLGGTKILGIRADEEGRMEAELRRATEAAEGLEHVVDGVCGVIRELTPEGDVDAIGIGSPGPLDPQKGEVYDPPNLPGWVVVPLLQLVRERLGLADDFPLVLVNDGHAAALAEYRYGAGSERVLGRRIKHMVYLSIGTGVGGGVIADGKLLLGARGMAAHLGHITIDANGPHCNCGSIGCLEALASGTALAREASVVVASRRETLISKAVGGDPSRVTAEIVVKAARDGDPIALDLMEREGELVGVGVVTCIHVFDPELVVLGGGVANAGELLFKPVRDTVYSRVERPYVGTFDIVPVALGRETGALGAVAAVLEEMRAREEGWTT